MRGQTVLVTGGSGTFGTAFVRYALSAGVERVIVLSRGEHRQAEMKRQFPDPRLECWIGDVRDRDRLKWAFRSQPDIVIHAAALKTIEACEQDPSEAVKTNINGTKNVVDEAMLADVPRVLVISSDKAAEPVTTYGKTKAAAEAIAIGQNAYRGRGCTRVSVVRYGNVEASAGSIAPMFKAKGANGEPVPITHPEMTRFWWGVNDAVCFVDHILDGMGGGEIFIPKLKSHRIVDVARRYAPESPHEIIGLRKVEKLHELMVSVDEAPFTWELPDRYVILMHANEWWSAKPPSGAVKVPDRFRYASDMDLSPVA